MGYDRRDIVDSLINTNDLLWYRGEIEKADIEHIFNISSDDWKQDGICVPDFKLMTSSRNIQNSFQGNKQRDILNKLNTFQDKPELLDKVLFLVADKLDGPFTLIEGNRRGVALCILENLAGIEVFLGVSPSIKSYKWARYSYLLE